ncbi:hypothetical protein LCGC14_2125820 [marine sediment metagenome]|uniref:DNA (cytosine-5-)-methyltransferase n=1 Tax=marine sediment metagenome TaxID=412755 RepID=A0A0F9E2Y6_9ZZZZ
MWIIPKSSMFCHFVPATEASSLDLAKYSEILSDALLWRSKHSQPATWLLRLISRAGKRKGKADPRHLWPFIRDHIRAIRPVFVICENVAGHLSLGFDRVVSDLDDLGYTTTPGIYAAEEVGAPHRRERLFIVAVASGSGAGHLLAKAQRRSGTEMLRQIDRAACASGADPAGRDGQLAHTGGVRSGTGTERIGWQTRSNADRGGEGSKLAHAESGGRGQAGECGSDPANGTAGTGSIMGDTGREGLEGNPGQLAGHPAIPAGSGCELADGDGTGCKEQCGSEPVRQEHATAQCGGHQRWPARPGQPRHEWEQPRVILSAADYKILKRYVEKYQTSLTEGQAEAMAHAEALYAPEPEMGGVAYGFTSRVDELRLLGNGVIPEQFEMALIDILRRIEMESGKNLSVVHGG